MISILNNTIYGIVAALCATALFVGSVSVVNAQSSMALSVTPTLFEMSANPGQVWQSSVKVINSNPYDITVYASVVNFAPQGETGQGKFLPVFEDVTGGATLAEWVDIQTEAVTIEREQSGQIPFVVTVPEDASPGGHFAAILISTRPPNPEDGALAVRTAQIVTSLFFVRVAGDVNEAGNIRSFSATQSFYQKPEATFELRFENKGNVHLQPRGEIVITNMWGKERGKIPINYRTHFGNVLPDSIRKFEFSWSGEQSITDIGRYKAVAALAYGSNETKFVSRATYFWVIPVKSLLITLGSLFAVIFAIMWAIKLYIRRMLQLSGIQPDQYQHRRVQNATNEADIRINRYKKISAPVTSGYDDLRSRLSGAHALLDWFRAIAAFTVAYKRFFLGITVVGVAFGLGAYFILDVTDKDKSYEITISNPDTKLNLNSEEIAYADLSEDMNITASLEKQQAYELVLTNTSAVVGTAAREAVRLTEMGYAVSALNANAERVDKRTVIVFDTVVQEEALTLSKLLGGALLSARTSTSSEDTANITVFVGADRIVD